MHNDWMPRGTARIVLALTLGAAGWSSPLAWSAELPAADSSAACSVDSGHTSGALNCKLGDAFATVTLAPFEGLIVQASSPPIDANAIHGVGAMARLTYTFQVLGGNPGDIVPILIAASLNSSGSDPTHGIGFASLNVHTAAAGDAQIAVCSDGTCGTSNKSFFGTLSTRARSGELGDTLTLFGSASTGDSLSFETARASADPFIFVDPTAPNASQYSIVLSPGVANAVASVPEPGSALALALGGPLLWSWRRWCRRDGRLRA